MTRVLFVAESFYPVFGGGERHIQDLSAALAAQGLAATVLTRRGERSWPREEQLGAVRVLRVWPTGPGRIGKYAMLPAVLAALRRERARYDVAIVCGTRVLGLPVLLAAGLHGKPVVLQPEMTGELTGEIYVWGTPLNRPFVARLLAPFMAARNALFRRAAAFVAISRVIEREALASGLLPQRLAYIPHAADTERFRPAEAGEKEALRARLGLPQACTLITFTGRLLKGKGLEVLIEAFARLVQEHPQAHLAILGSGQAQALSVEDAVHVDVLERGLASRVTFTGRVDNVEEYLRASDVFAFPSFYEGLPHSPVEAAASGLPAVASRTGGIPDVIVHGGSGLLLEPGDVDGLSAALDQLLSDATLRERFGRRARALALESFSLKAVTRRYQELFENVARQASERASRAPGRRS